MLLSRIFVIFLCTAIHTDSVSYTMSEFLGRGGPFLSSRMETRLYNDSRDGELEKHVPQTPEMCADGQTLKCYAASNICVYC